MIGYCCDVLNAAEPQPARLERRMCPDCEIILPYSTANFLEGTCRACALRRKANKAYRCYWKDPEKARARSREGARVYMETEGGRKAIKAYAQSSAGKERTRNYNNSEKGKARHRRYRATEKGIEANRKYDSSEKGKARFKRYYEKKKAAKAAARQPE